MNCGFAEIAKEPRCLKTLTRSGSTPDDLHTRSTIPRANSSVRSGAPNETSNQASVGSLALGTTTVYFIGSDHVFSVPRSITATTAQMLASLTTASGVIADGTIGVDDQSVYFRGSTAGVTADPQAGYVLRLAR